MDGEDEEHDAVSRCTDTVRKMARITFGVGCGIGGDVLSDGVRRREEVSRGHQQCDEEILKIACAMVFE